MKMALSSNTAFSSLFSRGRSAIIGMIHVQALPGTPRHRYSLAQITEKACSEAEIYRQCGLDGVLVENMHDLPYQRCTVGPEIVASMTRVCCEVRKVVKELPMGVQLLAGANAEALAVAHSCGAQFIRAEGFIFSHVADEGWMDSCASQLLRYRKAIGAANVLILTDIRKKHCSHVVTGDLDICDVAKAAEFFLSDGLILTGTSTGIPADARQLKKVKNAVSLPVIVGSGVTQENMEAYLSADGIIIGSHFKTAGLWHGDIDRNRVERFMDRINAFQARLV